MKLDKKLFIPVVALAIVGGTAASAAAAPTSSNGRSLAQEIANKFNLDKSQVQTVIDQHHSSTRQNREAKYKDRLDQAVKDGKLTEAQKQAVLAEHDKLTNELKSASTANRKEARKQVRQEAKDWAQQNNIDAKWLMPGRGIGEHQSSI